MLDTNDLQALKMSLHEEKLWETLFPIIMYTLSVTYGDHCLRYRHCGRQKLPCSLYIMEDTAPDNVS